MSPVVARLYRYPVKGLNAQALTATTLQPGHGLPLDRVFALAPASAVVDAVPSEWVSESHFVTLARHERLAAIDARYEAATGVLALYRRGRKVTQGNLATPIGRAMIEEFFRAYLKHELPAPPHLIGSVTGPRLSDQSEPGLSIVGLASITDLERVVGASVDPLRLRASIYVTGTAPWEEFGWVGQEIAVGTARLLVKERVTPTAAADVAPGTGIRDQHIARSLMSGFGHAACGVFATVVGAGDVAIGDPIIPPGGGSD